MVTSMLDLFQDPFFVGFNRELERFKKVQTNSTGYPPYDLIKIDEDTYQVDIALAGFAKDDIEVTVDNGSLIIKGEKKASTDDSNTIHKGISSRKFTRIFALGEYMEVTNAELVDGLLTVKIERIVPEDKKPKQVQVK
jgi:molecular chaperone IbpA